MRPDHHLDESTLLSYSAGALPLALSVVVSAHLAMCPQCQAGLRQAEAIGGALLQMATERGDDERADATGQAPSARHEADARAAMLRRLDDPGLLVDRADASARDKRFGTSAPPSTQRSGNLPTDDDRLPLALHPHFGTTFSGLRWHFLAPGVRHIRARVPEGRLFLLKLAPGVRLPEHGHGCNELTLVLRGAYTDRFGEFRAGDIADLDMDAEHQPTITSDEPCITLAATDAPIRIKNRGLRLLQPWFRM